MYLGRSSCSSAVLANRMLEMWPGDAPKIMQLVFQQSKSYIYLEGPQFQFIDRVLDISVFSQRIGTLSPNCAEMEISRVQFFWTLLKRPLTSQRQVHPDRFALVWLDSGYMFCDCTLAVWQNFVYFLRESGIQILRSTSAGWGGGPRPLAVWRSMHSRCFSFFFGENSHISASPLYFAVIQVFSGFFKALDDEEFFVIEGSGVAGSPRSLDSQVTRHQFVSETLCSVVVFCCHTHRSSKPASETTTTDTDSVGKVPKSHPRFTQGVHLGDKEQELADTWAVQATRSSAPEQCAGGLTRRSGSWSVRVGPLQAETSCSGGWPTACDPHARAESSEDPDLKHINTLSTHNNTTNNTNNNTNNNKNTQQEHTTRTHHNTHRQRQRHNNTP